MARTKYLVDGIIYPMLRSGVQRAGCFIQSQYRWFFQYSTRYCDPLALPTTQAEATDCKSRQLGKAKGKANTTLTLRIESLWHPPYKFTVSFPCGVLNLLSGGVAVSVCNIRCNGSREEDRVLRNNSDQVTPGSSVEFSNIWCKRVITNCEAVNWYTEKITNLARRM
jgi:hypothetical protein